MVTVVPTPAVDSNVTVPPRRSTVVRLAWIFFILFGGSGILAYIIAMIVMPERPDEYDDL